MLKPMERIKELVRQYLRPHMIVGYKDKNGKFLSEVRYSSTVVFMSPENLEIGDLVFIFHNSIIDASNGLAIGEGCQIGAWTGVFTHSSHIAIRLYGDQYRKVANPVAYIKGRVALGEYSFIGPHCIIMPGTNIGKGSIVSAFSYVKGDFPDFAIIAGNPAKIVGDTRKLDSKYLQEYPEIVPLYEKWAGSKPDNT